MNFLLNLYRSMIIYRLKNHNCIKQTIYIFVLYRTICLFHLLCENRVQNFPIFFLHWFLEIFQPLELN